MNRRAPEDALLDSWQHNAQAWIDAVRSGAIERRREMTDAQAPGHRV